MEEEDDEGFAFVGDDAGFDGEAEFADCCGEPTPLTGEVGLLSVRIAEFDGALVGVDALGAAGFCFDSELDEPEALTAVCLSIVLLLVGIEGVVEDDEDEVEDGKCQS